MSSRPSNDLMHVNYVLEHTTDPGKQLQVDFTIIRRGAYALKAFVATLGYSRASYVRFYDNERTEAWIDGLEHSFDFFGGVPHEVLFDNAKTIMIERDAYSDGESTNTFGNGLPNSLNFLLR